MSVVYVDVDAGVVGESGSGTKERTYQELQRLIWEGTPCDLVTLWKALSAPVPIRVGDLWTLPSSRSAHNGGKLNRYMCMCAAPAPARARENARMQDREHSPSLLAGDSADAALVMAITATTPITAWVLVCVEQASRRSEALAS